MLTLKTVTLGCKVNQYETEYLRQGFERLGYREAVDGEPVDLCIVNSCTVTAESEAKSRKTIRRLAKAHPEAELIVMGCYATRAADDVAALPGVVEVITDKRQLAGLLARRGLADVPAGIDYFKRRRRAYVKVQDGCQNHCSYCIIPSVRPNLASRPIEEVLDEVRRLISHGHHEIVLTGIHLGHYGRNEEASSAAGLQERLSDLVRRIAELDGSFRVRLSSIEAAEVTPELLAIMAERPDRICVHLHVPMQSGSDAVLERMNRRWPIGRFVERCREIQAVLDWPALTTDVIVGFPGETETEFAATCRAVEQVGFAKVHVFRFSPRAGTPAASMPDQVTNSIVQRRARDLEELGNMLRERYGRSLLGRRLQVLVERPAPGRPGWMVGACNRSMPVSAPGGRELIGQFISVTPDRWEGILVPVAEGIPRVSNYLV